MENRNLLRKAEKAESDMNDAITALIGEIEQLESEKALLEDQVNDLQQRIEQLENE